MFAINPGIPFATGCVVVALLTITGSTRELSPVATETPCDTAQFDYCLPGGVNPTTPVGTDPGVPWGVSIQNFPYKQH